MSRPALAEIVVIHGRATNSRPSRAVPRVFEIFIEFGGNCFEKNQTPTPVSKASGNAMALQRNAAPQRIPLMNAARLESRDESFTNRAMAKLVKPLNNKSGEMFSTDHGTETSAAVQIP